MIIIRHSLWTFIVLLITLSCNDRLSSLSNEATNFKIIHIEIASPYACSNFVEIKNTWAGTASIGYGDTLEKRTIKGKTDFIIKPDSVKTNISNIINQIKMKIPVHSTYGYDLYHFSLTIDGKKFIDKYGADSLLDKLLFILMPNVQIEHSGQCDYFYLLQQALKKH